MKRFSQGLKDFVLNPSFRQQTLDRWKQARTLSLKKVIGLTIVFYTGGSTYYLATNNEAFSIKMNLSRNVSRLSGWFAGQTIPVGLRKTLFGAFASTYGVIQEDMVQPLEYYTTFNEFFTRQVKPRTIDTNENMIVSPADSKILTIKEITGDSNLLIKGVNYKLGEFLTGRKEVVLDDKMFDTLKLAKNPDSKLYQAIFYLNPGDYHRYHSPTDLVVKRRNHILGYLAPVKESYISTHERVYEGNERVAIFGEWKFGQFSQVYVGATNVGSMTIEFDKEVKTNEKIDLNFKSFVKSNIREFKSVLDSERVQKTVVRRPDLQEFSLEELEALNDVGKPTKVPPPFKQDPAGIIVPKGAEIGRFNLGSTVVVIFEAAGNLNWFVKEGDKVRYGQPVCEVIVPPQNIPSGKTKNKK